MWSGKAKQGGKGKGKGKSPEGGKGHTLPRTRISAEKFSGIVLAWKGKYGWIQPGEEIEHEKAKLHNGGLFVSTNDVVGTKELTAGVPVEFHIWEDESGLGAEEVVSTGPPTAAGKAAVAQAAAGKNGGGGKFGPKGQAAGSKSSGKDWAGSSWGGGGSSWGNGSGGSWGGGSSSWGKDLWGKGGSSWGNSAKAGKGGKGYSGPGASVMNTVVKQPVKGAFAQSVAKGKAKGKDKSSNRGKGHLLPRTRVSADKFTGTVLEWKGKYGWVQPAEPIEHEKAKRHGGKIFVSKDDVEGFAELTPGATCEFHIWEDPSGLGAEEVVQY